MLCLSVFFFSLGAPDQQVEKTRIVVISNIGTPDMKVLGFVTVTISICQINNN